MMNSVGMRMAWTATILVALVTGCTTPHRVRADRDKHVSWKFEGVVRRVRCLYELRPWLNLDRAGDRDPEGIRYRVFLDTGQGRGVHRDGMFHIEMYRIGRDENGDFTRDLVSDWHYPTSMVHKIAKPGKLGEGYFLHLRWARKDIAGREIEIITQFEDEYGNISRSGTKRLPVPKYTS